jgi:hypothetical protein
MAPPKIMTAAQIAAAKAAAMKNLKPPDQVRAEQMAKAKPAAPAAKPK